MRDFEIPKERWLQNLRPLFNDDARRLVRGLEMEQQVYPNIKTTILEAYAAEKGSISLSAKRKPGQTPSQCASQQVALGMQGTEGLNIGSR